MFLTVSGVFAESSCSSPADVATVRSLASGDAFLIYRLKFMLWFSNFTPVRQHVHTLVFSYLRGTTTTGSLQLRARDHPNLSFHVAEEVVKMIETAWKWMDIP